MYTEKFLQQVHRKGKKTYAYLPKEEKQIVDEIFRKLAENEEIKNMYDEWCSLQQKIVGFYHDKQIEFPPLVENKEFKKTKNAIVSEAVNLGNNLFFDKEADKKTEEKKQGRGHGLFTRQNGICGEEIGDRFAHRTGAGNTWI